MSDPVTDNTAARWGRPTRRVSRQLKPTASPPATPAAVGTAGPLSVPPLPEPRASQPPPPPVKRADPDTTDFELRDLVMHIAQGIVDHQEDVQVDILAAGEDASFEL